jgi:hypothetical protein
MRSTPLTIGIGVEISTSIRAAVDICDRNPAQWGLRTRRESQNGGKQGRQYAQAESPEIMFTSTGATFV